MKEIILIIIISYLLGNFQTSYILGRLIKKTDIREFGSGNAGTTNALRVYGKKFAIITLLLDALKGVVAVLIGRYILDNNGELIAGISVVMGHNWPVFLKFRGGKGVATTLGVALTTTPISGLISIVIGIIIIIKTKYVSLGTMLAIVMWTVVSILINRAFDQKFFVFTLILAIMAIYKHKANISRLLKGEESKIGKKV